MAEVSNQEIAKTSLQRGIELLNSGDRLRALSFIEKAHRLNPSSRTRSFLGMLTALDRGRLAAGIAMCRQSLDEQADNPEYLFNYGRALFKAGQKKEAFDAIRKSVLHGGGEEPLRWLDEQGIRRPPVFRFLRRSHPLNKYIGLVLKHLEVR